MSEQIKPGDGWRLLGPEEFIQSGDEVWSFEKQSWIHPQTLLGLIASPFHAVRRRIPAKPEPVCIDGHTIELIDGFPMFSNLSRRQYLFSSKAAAIRKFSQWLAQVADWREAQEKAK